MNYMNIGFNSKAQPNKRFFIFLKGSNPKRLASQSALPEKVLSDEKDLSFVNSQGNFCCIYWVSRKDIPGSLRKRILRSRSKRVKTGEDIGLYFGSGTTKFFEETIQALLMAQYEVGLFKGDRSKKEAGELIIQSEVSRDQRIVARKCKEVWEAQSFAMDLVNLPGNKLRPEDLANFAKTSGKTHGYKVTVLSKAQIEKKGLDALLAVNRGSEWPPAFIIAEYKGKSRKKNPPKVG
ncbi:MAG: hypothetical protein HKN16_06925, partial [Saprospiraceae bacterium]|nr:hypothetical protein [Saprospiraceae bacterium]